MNVSLVTTVLLTLAALSPSASRAQHWPKRSLDEIVDRSGAVVVATARAVDPAAYDFDTKEALTRVDFDVTEVLFGTLPNNSLSFLLRGGLRPDGTLEVDSITSNFVPKETYLLFVKDGPYYITPFTNGAALRILTRNGVSSVVDEGGHVVELSASGMRAGTRQFEDVKTLQARIFGWGFSAQYSAEQATQKSVPGMRTGGPVSKMADIDLNGVSDPGGDGMSVAEPDPSASKGLQRVRDSIARIQNRKMRVRSSLEYRPRRAP